MDPKAIRSALTADEFERAYAERSHVTVELRQYLTVRPCSCGEDVCEGWQMVSHEHAAEIDSGERFPNGGINPATFDFNKRRALIALVLWVGALALLWMTALP